MKRLVLIMIVLTWSVIGWAADRKMTYLDTNKLGYKEYINPKDSSVLIEIPADSFMMGSNHWYDMSYENPMHSVYLDKYYIGKYEVTVGQFRKFCDATDRTIPEQPYWNTDYNYPVMKVSWNDAKAYCDWAGLRLPTEAEWEKAARGTDGRKYPWGNEWDSTKCNHGSAGTDASDGYEYSSPVGSYPAGISPYGAYDMAGNVWEWCNDWYNSAYYRSSPYNVYFDSSPYSNPKGPSSGSFRVLRGGSYVNQITEYGCVSRHYAVPVCPLGGTHGVGFRVAK